MVGIALRMVPGAVEWRPLPYVPYPLAVRLCYNSGHRGTCREELPCVRRSPGSGIARVPCGTGRGSVRARGIGSFRVAWGVRTALLSRLLAEAGISPV